MKLYAIVWWNLRVGAGYFLATQSYLSCSCLLERIAWKNGNSEFFLNEEINAVSSGI